MSGLARTSLEEFRSDLLTVASEISNFDELSTIPSTIPMYD